MSFSCSLGGVDVSRYVKAFTRDGSVCEVAFGMVVDLDTNAPTIQPAQSATMDVDGVRWFTGYVNSITTQRIRGEWVNRVVCDHYALKRLRDWFWTSESIAITDWFVIGVINYMFIHAGASYYLDSSLGTDFIEIEMPPYTFSTGTSAFDVVMDCCLFGMAQANPYPDGTIHFQKMSAASEYIDLTDRTTHHERRVDDAYFRTDALVLGWATESALVSGSSPYGYKRTMVVANPHLISSSWTWRVAAQLLAEYNELSTIEKDTIPTRERINLGDSIGYTSDKYTKSGIVMRHSASANEGGFVQTFTAGEKCPKIFGFERQLPPPVARLIIHNHKHILISNNFFDVTQEAEWTDITPDGIEFICSLSIDENDRGAWLVTACTDKVADGDANGVFRTSSIQGGGWSLVLSQNTAETLGKAAKLALGWSRLDFGELRSCISFGNGYVCAPEVAWEGSGDRDPTATFTSTNGGGSWTVAVISGYQPTLVRYWCGEYLEKGCHQIDWDGSSLIIAGISNRALLGWSGCLATSGDGATWELAHQSPLYSSLRSCKAIGGNIFARDEDAGQIIVLPNTAYGPVRPYGAGFTRFEWEGNLCQIVYTATQENTELYVGTSPAFVSGGGIGTVSVANGGSGYSVNDILTLAIPEGGTSATVQVTSVSGTVVTGIAVLTAGTGYSTGIKTTTGGGGSGCTVNILTISNGTPLFGIARMYGASEFCFVALGAATSGEIATYWLAGTHYDRTGNLLGAIGGTWEGTVSVTNNAMDSSGMEAIATSD